MRWTPYLFLTLTLLALVNCGLGYWLDRRVIWWSSGHAWDTATKQDMPFAFEAITNGRGEWRLGYSLNGASAVYPLIVSANGRASLRFVPAAWYAVACDRRHGWWRIRMHHDRWIIGVAPSFAPAARPRDPGGAKMTPDEITDRTLVIIRLLSDLKEDVLHEAVSSDDGNTPHFNGGVLSAALTILEATLDEDDPRLVIEARRQCEQRLGRALATDGTSSPRAESSRLERVPHVCNERLR